jgi:chromosomal replication initiation ATPase DnaA
MDMGELDYRTDTSDANRWARSYEKREARYAKQEAQRLDRLARQRRAYQLRQAHQVMKAAGVTQPLEPVCPMQTGDAMHRIVQEVADKYRLTVTALKSPARYRVLAWPRQEAMARMYSETSASLPRIGRFFDRDHTTVLHGIRAYNEREAANG